MAPDPKQQKIGRRAQRKGNRAENRDLRWFKEAFADAGFDGNETQRIVRSRRLDEATDIKTGADYEVAWRLYPLLVQRKHLSQMSDSIPKIWNKLLGALKNKPADTRPMIHLEIGKVGRRPGNLNVCVMRDSDIVGLDQRSGELAFGQPVTWSGKSFHLVKWWTEAVEQAAYEGGDPRLVLRFAGLGQTLGMISWPAFCRAFEALLRSR